MAALASGAVDAALISPPFIFTAQAAGYRDLGDAATFAHDIPFSGTAVNIGWATAHMALLRGWLRAYDDAVVWFDQDANKATADGILVAAVHANPAEAAESYDYFRKLDMFDRSSALAPSQLQSLVSALVDSGDLPKGFDPSRLVLRGLSAP
jgi:NitT/TauT family transport system substrate-binding protein